MRGISWLAAKPVNFSRRTLLHGVSKYAVQSWAMASSFLRSFEITENNTPQSVGLPWTSDQPCRRDLYWQHTTLTTDKHPCPRAGFKSTISAGEQPQTYPLNRAATGTGSSVVLVKLNWRTVRLFTETQVWRETVLFWFLHTWLAYLTSFKF